MNAAVQSKATPQQKKVPIKGELICIDLPGEDFKIQGPGCFVVKDYTLLLRKHRDVVFDLNTGNGATYTVESKDDWFYDYKAGKRTKSATFKDGERFHIWVSRNFRTTLTLKSGTKILSSYPIGMMDTQSYGSDPYHKPAPIIVSLSKSSSNNNAPTPSISTAHKPSGLDVMNAPLPELDGNVITKAPLTGKNAGGKSDSGETMHVIEVSPSQGANVPQQIADFFKKGGEETAIDTSGVMTRNWLWTQIIGSMAYYSDNQKWIKELWSQKFYLQKVVHKNAGAKWYIVFKGRPGLREYMNAAKYGAGSTKVLSITSGAGSAKGLRHATWDAAKGSFKKAGILSIFFTVTLDTAEWLHDYEQRDPVTGKPKRDFFDLAFKIGVDFAKAGISAALGTAVMAGLIVAATSLAAIAGATLLVPVSVVVVGTIVLAIGIGYALDWADKKSGATDKLNSILRDSASYLEKRIPPDYGKYDNALEQAILYGGLGA